jgi:hypothetical protein
MCLFSTISDDLCYLLQVALFLYEPTHSAAPELLIALKKEQLLSKLQSEENGICVRQHNGEQIMCIHGLICTPNWGKLMFLSFSLELLEWNYYLDSIYDNY